MALDSISRLIGAAGSFFKLKNASGHVVFIFFSDFRDILLISKTEIAESYKWVTIQELTITNLRKQLLVFKL